MEIQASFLLTFSLAFSPQDLEYIQTIWEINAEWESNWASWKAGKFSELQTSEMETNANTTFRKLAKFSRELKDKNWDIVEISKTKVDQFRRTMPLIQDLKNPAMRDRHWFQIKAEMAKQFDENSDDFTLERIIEIGFDSHSEIVNEVSGAASKELAIENTLAQMEKQWTSIELDMATYKDKGHFKLRTTDDVFQVRYFF